jgi:hypothetical protein
VETRERVRMHVQRDIVPVVFFVLLWSIVMLEVACKHVGKHFEIEEHALCLHRQWFYQREDEEMVVVKVSSGVSDRINSVDGLTVIYNMCETKCVRIDKKKCTITTNSSSTSQTHARLTISHLE